MSNDRKYWFPAKTYGWGWGLPISWQGWVVLALYIALVVVGAWLFRPGQEPAMFFAFVVVVTAVLVGICWLTGEPPRWRWGKR